MNKVLKATSILIAANLVTNAALRITRHGSVGFVHYGFDRLARATKFAVTPAPITAISMRQETAHLKRRLTTI